jgi:hypothetical protein
MILFIVNALADVSVGSGSGWTDSAGRELRFSRLRDMKPYSVVITTVSEESAASILGVEAELGKHWYR